MQLIDSGYLAFSLFQNNALEETFDLNRLESRPNQYFFFGLSSRNVRADGSRGGRQKQLKHLIRGNLLVID